MGIIGSNLDGAIWMPFVQTSDIAKIAFGAITSLEFDRQSPFYIVCDVATFEDVAKHLGRALGK